MSFLDELKAQKGLGTKKKPPPKPPKPEKPSAPAFTGSFPANIGVNSVMLADGNTVLEKELVKGTYVHCLSCGLVKQGLLETFDKGRFCSHECRVKYPYKFNVNGKPHWTLANSHLREIADDEISTLAAEWTKPTVVSSIELIGIGERTRELWLSQAMDLLDMRLFREKASVVVPECRVSVGFPAGTRKRQINKTLGQYWPKASASDGIPQIFISPAKGASHDPVNMLAVLVHEMVHACTEGAGHGPAFRKIAIKVGLTGPMRSTTAGAKLKALLKSISDELGPFPHGTIDTTTRPGRKGKLKGHECDTCGFKFYTTQKWMDSASLSGEPMCCPDANCIGQMKFVPPVSG